MNKKTNLNSGLIKPQPNVNNIEGNIKSEVYQPYILETSNYEWVKWDGDNLFPKKLIDAFNTSPIHNSIILLKRDMCVGKNVLIEPEKKGIFSFFSSQKHKPTQDFISKCNSNGESLRDVLFKMFEDYLVFGMCYFQPIFNRKGNRLEIYHIPTDRVRVGKVEQEGVIKKFYYSADWEQYRKAEYKPKTLNRFDYKNLGGQNLVQITPYRSGNFYYPLPDYFSAMNYILLDGKISRFHLSNIDNGLTPSLIIQMNNGIPPEEMRKEIMSKITETLAGSFNSGKFILMFNNTKEEVAVIDTIDNNDLDKQFVMLNEMVVQNIITASRVSSPLLVGVKTAGQLGQSNEMSNAFEIFYNISVQPIQRKIMDELNKVTSMVGYKTMTIENASPIDFVWSESILGKILSINEMRYEIGKEPIEDGDNLVDYIKQEQNVPKPTKNNDEDNE